MFAGVIVSMLGDADNLVRAAFIKAAAGGDVRLQSLEARVRKASQTSQSRFEN